MNKDAPFYNLHPSNSRKALTIRNVFDFFTLSNTPYSYDTPASSTRGIATTVTPAVTAMSSSDATAADAATADTVAVAEGEDDLLSVESHPRPPPSSPSPPAAGFGLVGFVGGWFGGGGALGKQSPENTKLRLRGQNLAGSSSRTSWPWPHCVLITLYIFFSYMNPLLSILINTHLPGAISSYNLHL